ncbi:MAG: TIGR04283 family arsenosugar biosynthesis glycosyltransferase [bacterium]
MRNHATVAVIIPAFNEEQSIGQVVTAIPQWVDDIIVVDNGSTDCTAEVARQAKARVVSEPCRGYGSACHAGIAALNRPDVVVFLDADFSDHPDEMNLVVDPIVNGEADLVIGSRTLGRSEAGALTLQARLGNRLACTLIKMFWNVGFTDLGPFRAIRYTELERLRMCDRDYGWTVEMQIRAVRQGLRICEVPVSYRKRIGQSKISGTLKGIIGAGTKILSIIFLFAIDSCFSHYRIKTFRDRLIIFTRYPEPGKTKTRLIPALGPEGAADLQRQMTCHTLNTARALSQCSPVSIQVYFEGGDEDRMRDWLGADIRCRPQHSGDLGERMLHAFEEAFAEGMKRVVIMGTDCPGITVNLIQQAFREVPGSDVVLGPAKDGGYYLICLKRAIPELFVGIPWGTEEVLNRTERIARDLGLTVACLGPLDDIDRPEDLSVWEKEKACFQKSRIKTPISVIIPTLNEADNLAAALRRVKTGDHVEVIVVDGGSQDDTENVARSHGVNLLNSPRGRARQMNAGAAAAKGEILLFLHADTCLPEKYDEQIRRIITQRGTVGGAFEFRLDFPSWGLRFIERAANWRSRVFQMPYGDQGIFVKAGIFHEIGGFPDLPIMEDYELICRLRRKGSIVIAPVPAVTSARRWLSLGTYRTTLLNQLCVAAYRLGVSPSRIAR